MDGPCLQQTLSDCTDNAETAGYTGIIFLYHHVTEQVIVQWTGLEINQATKTEAEATLLKLFKEANSPASKDDSPKIETFDDLFSPPTDIEIKMEPELVEQEATRSVSEVNFLGMPGTISAHSADHELESSPAKLAELRLEILPLTSDDVVSTALADELTTELADAIPNLAELDGSPKYITALSQVTGAALLNSSNEYTATTKKRKKHIVENMSSSSTNESAGLSSGSRLNAAMKATTRWISPDTNRQIHDVTLESVGVGCSICGCNKIVSLRRQKIHIRQHFTNFFCPCGYNSLSRDVVFRHQKRLCLITHEYRHLTSTIHEVDKPSYKDWADYFGLKNAPPYPSSRPALDERESNILDSGEIDSNLILN